MVTEIGTLKSIFITVMIGNLFSTVIQLMIRKNKRSMSIYMIAFSLVISLIGTSCVSSKVADNNTILINDQGSFAVGGTVISNPGTFDPIKHGVFNPSNQSSEGQTLHGDHAYVFYQIPVSARKYPLVFWHGFGQSDMTWETTPDGREGFQNIFLRRNFPVYLIDQQ